MKNKLTHLLSLLVFTLMYTTSYAQEKTVSGTVTDQSNLPLPGVNVLVKGASRGTTTDFDGNFNISVSSGETLVFSYVGFKSAEQVVGSESVYNISLETDNAQLDEVVVVGYGTQKKTSITGAVASFSAEGLDERPLVRMDQALVGQLAGVRVKQTSGVPGAGFTIQVRGSGSINASNEPLYVVDGFPLDTDGQPSNLNPNDIESIQVLKDASSTAIYGSRGSNGVVLITTKRGKSGKPKISFNTYAGWNETVKKLDVLSAEEWVERAIEHQNYAYVRNYGNQGATSSDTNDQRRAILGLGPDDINTAYMYDERWLMPGHPGLDYVDWQDLYFRKGLVQSYQLSATGGNDKARYYISGDYSDQEGIAIGVNNERFNLRANVEVSPSENLKFGINLAPSFGTIDDPGVEGKDAITHIIVGMTPVVESSVGALYTNTGDFTRYAWAGSRVSPLAEATFNKRTTKRFRNLATVFLEYEFLKGLKYKGTINSDLQMNTTNRFTPSWITRNRTASGSKTGDTRTSFVTEHTLNYVKSFGNHNLNALAGYSYNEFNFEDYSISATGFPSDDIETLNVASTTSGSTSKSKNTLISYFGRLQYDYNEKYFFQATLRRDGSSRFGDNTKFGTFPSLSAGWRITEEDFMKDNGIFNELKLRGSWGLSGNNNIGNYESIANLSNTNYSFGGSFASGQSPSNFANPDLSWEKSESINIGLDIGLFNSRIFTSLEYYTKRNTDLLLSIPVPTSSGFGTALTNIGEVLNKGWEVELTTRNLVGGDFTWTTSANLSHNTNEVKQLGPNNTPILGGSWDITHNILEVGKPMYTLFLVQQDGLLTTEDINNGVPMYGNQEAGDPKYVDQNGDGVITADDRTYSGHPDPSYVWGITNTFKYKGFDLSVQLQGQWGGKIYSTFGRAMYRTGMGIPDNTLGLARDRYIWQEGAIVTEADLAGKTRKSPSSFGRIKNTDWLYDNDYWRVRNISLGYDLGSQIQSELISGARIYFTMENWFGGDKYDGGFNPEAVNNSGDDYGAFPLSRSIILGLNLNF
ncbi:SusC/RagA family TonB-linked outer membrane protein [Aestuariibaculum lutulentum]|uniref:TonB-dependent receptor n=1 Tax=Aestuariibaculum lutulentum TaxID=2920935 RepID=A0ABS9RFL3_9FLAO|nr:TonB-dependent receptor [Aestuariibaculum lutulentum]MCH4551735.1 TonB-dependent receptor [Aestuariibaculum lutulentum]